MIAVLLGVGFMALIAYGLWQDRQKDILTRSQVKPGAKFKPCYGDNNPFTRKEVWYIVEEIREDYVKVGCYIEGVFKDSSTMTMSSFLMWFYFVEE